MGIIAIVGRGWITKAIKRYCYKQIIKQVRKLLQWFIKYLSKAKRYENLLKYILKEYKKYAKLLRVLNIELLEYA